MIVGSLGWHAALLIFAHTQSMTGGILCLIAAGFCQSMSLVSLQVVLLGTSQSRFRGLVMGVRMLAIYGLPVGLLAAGVLIGWIGFGAMGTLYAAIGIAFTLAIAVHWRAEIWRAEEDRV
jgi:hypothetical protein